MALAWQTWIERREKAFPDEKYFLVDFTCISIFLCRWMACNSLIHSVTISLRASKIARERREKSSLIYAYKGKFCCNFLHHFIFPWGTLSDQAIHSKSFHLLFPQALQIYFFNFQERERERERLFAVCTQKRKPGKVSEEESMPCHQPSQDKSVESYTYASRLSRELSTWALSQHRELTKSYAFHILKNNLIFSWLCNEKWLIFKRGNLRKIARERVTGSLLKKWGKKYISRTNRFVYVPVLMFPGFPGRKCYRKI